MTVTVTITPSTLLTRVKLIASFVGRNAFDDAGNPLYDEVRITTQDEPLLQDFLGEAKASILAAYAGVSGTDASGNIVLTLPDESLDAHEESIQTEALNFIVFFMCRGWFLLHLPSKAEEYQNKGALCIQKLNDLIYSRKAPAMPDGTSLPDIIPLAPESEPEPEPGTEP